MRAKITEALSEGQNGAWQALKDFGGGEYGIRSGLIPLDFDGYPIPDKSDPDRLANRDIDGMLMMQLLDETVALSRACKERKRLRGEGLKAVTMHKSASGGVQTWEDWVSARKAALSARLSHGGR